MPLSLFLVAVLCVCVCVSVSVSVCVCVGTTATSALPVRCALLPCAFALLVHCMYSLSVRFPSKFYLSHTVRYDIYRVGAATGGREGRREEGREGGRGGEGRLKISRWSNSRAAPHCHHRRLPERQGEKKALPIPERRSGESGGRDGGVFALARKAARHDTYSCLLSD